MKTIFLALVFIALSATAQEAKAPAREILVIAIDEADSNTCDDPKGECAMITKKALTDMLRRIARCKGKEAI